MRGIFKSCVYLLSARVYEVDLVLRAVHLPHVPGGLQSDYDTFQRDVQLQHRRADYGCRHTSELQLNNSSVWKAGEGGGRGGGVQQLTVPARAEPAGEGPG